MIRSSPHSTLTGVAFGVPISKSGGSVGVPVDVCVGVLVGVGVLVSVGVDVRV
jgi:hypothetical protein